MAADYVCRHRCTNADNDYEIGFGRGIPLYHSGKPRQVEYGELAGEIIAAKASIEHGTFDKVHFGLVYFKSDVLA